MPDSLPPRRKFQEPSAPPARATGRKTAEPHRLNWVVSLLVVLGIANLVATVGGLVVVSKAMESRGDTSTGVALIVAALVAGLTMFAAAAVVSTMIQMDRKLDRISP